jgi:signal transduction histidine kinase/CheY-like chemotaxis protein
LQHCIRDLAALNALPSMCIGRSPEEALEVILDALPNVLSCDLVYLRLPGAPPLERALLRGGHLGAAEVSALRAAIDGPLDGASVTAIPGAGDLYCFDAELPLDPGSRADGPHQGRVERGRLVVGRVAPIDPETDRVLFRSAANLVGTTLTTAHVLEDARRKDDFLAMLGHELRNPLAPIVTATELLARHPVATREREVIARNTGHLIRLVDDLLDISRVTRGHVELRHEPVALTSVLERAVEIALPLVNRHRHTLVVAPAEGLMLHGDPVRLAQIFGNLLTNAAKFTPPGGRIAVLVAHEGERVRVSIHDNGRGIAPDKLGVIFKPFVQVDRARDALRGGLGLGLAIVHNLVERHDGTISVESEGLDRGATFHVELPVEAGVQLAPASEERPAPSARSEARILVVDDNTDLADLLSDALRQQGFQTAVANDAQAALEAWRHFRPHAAVLDLAMPHFDGYELAQALRAEHGNEPTLIAATGYGQRKDRARASAVGFNCHFVKPVSIDELAHVLDQRVIPRLGTDE